MNREENNVPEAPGDSENSPHVSLIRRLAAVAYDSVALLATFFLCTLPIVIVLQGQAIAPNNPFYFAYLVVCAFLYFALSWTKGGQTLGMRAWKIKLVSSNQRGSISLTNALRRFGVACASWLAFGIGFISAVFDSRNRAWHDKWSGTHLERLK
ncbi:MAG: RDD family protein [Pseudomonadota bacterium]